MARSIQEMLDDCDAAMADCERSQMYTEKGRQQQRARYAELAAERARLMKMVGAPPNMVAGVGMLTRPT